MNRDKLNDAISHELWRGNAAKRLARGKFHALRNSEVPVTAPRLAALAREANAIVGEHAAMERTQRTDATNALRHDRSARVDASGHIGPMHRDAGKQATSWVKRGPDAFGHNERDALRTGGTAASLTVAEWAQCASESATGAGERRAVAHLDLQAAATRCSTATEAKRLARLVKLLPLRRVSHTTAAVLYALRRDDRAQTRRLRRAFLAHT